MALTGIHPRLRRGQNSTERRLAPSLTKKLNLRQLTMAFAKQYLPKRMAILSPIKHTRVALVHPKGIAREISFTRIVIMCEPEVYARQRNRKNSSHDYRSRNKTVAEFYIAGNG